MFTNSQSLIFEKSAHNWAAKTFINRLEDYRIPSSFTILIKDRTSPIITKTIGIAVMIEAVCKVERGPSMIIKVPGKKASTKAQNSLFHFY